MQIQITLRCECNLWAMARANTQRHTELTSSPMVAATVDVDVVVILHCITDFVVHFNQPLEQKHYKILHVQSRHYFIYMNEYIDMLAQQQTPSSTFKCTHRMIHIIQKYLCISRLYMCV